MNDFLTALINFPSNKWCDGLKSVNYTGLNGKEKGPKILVQMVGVKDNTQLMLANKAIIDWMAVMKNKSCKNKNYEFE